MARIGKHTVMIARSFTFEASHQLCDLPSGHPCGRVHGHTYQVMPWFNGNLDEHQPWHTDFGDLDRLFEQIRAEVDHQHLNEIAGMLTTSAEHVAWWLFRRIKEKHPTLFCVELQEGPRSWVRVHSGGPLGDPDSIRDAHRLILGFLGSAGKSVLWTKLHDHLVGVDSGQDWATRLRELVHMGLARGAERCEITPRGRAVLAGAQS